MGLGIFGGGMGRVDWVRKRVADKDVLDIGVVQHNPENYLLPNWLHRHVSEASRSCVGVDNDARGVAFLRERGEDVIVADACALNLGRTFDAIVAGDVIEHLDNVAGFLAGVHAHLRPGGEFLVLTANPWFWVRFVTALRGRIHENPEHTMWLSPGTLTEVLRRYSFSVSEWEWGSSEPWLYYLPMPKMMRHTGFWLVAKPDHHVAM